MSSLDTKEKKASPPIKYFASFLEKTNLRKRDIDHFLYEINEIISQTVSEEEKKEFKKIRQRAYDLKKRLPIDLTSYRLGASARSDTFVRSSEYDSDESEQRLTPRSEVSALKSEFIGARQTFQSDPDGPTPHRDVRSSGSQSEQTLTHVYKRLMPYVSLSALVVFSGAFLVHQTLDLYASLLFPKPLFNALGAVMMAAFFACFHSIKRTKTSQFLCLCVMAYEVVFVCVATLKNESDMGLAVVNQDPSIQIIQEEMDRAHIAYGGVKGRFSDPTSQVYQSEWFKKTYVDPKWTAYKKAFEALSARKKELVKTSQLSLSESILKIVYRLGCVLVFMISCGILMKNKKMSGLI